MSLFARSDVSAISVSKSHGGCGTTHHRPADDGNPDPVWELECSACEIYLRTDPLFAPTISEVPETPDETKAREDAEKRGERAAKKSQAELNVRLTDILERLSQQNAIPAATLAALAPVPVITGLMECDAGHPNEAGMKFCGECGVPLRASGKRTCPDGHEVPAKMRFCGECGQPVDATPALEAAPAGPKRRLGDMRAEELRKVARDKGVDDSGSRTEVLARLRAA